MNPSPSNQTFNPHASRLGKSPTFRHYRCVRPAPNYVALLFPDGEVHEGLVKLARSEPAL